MNPEELLRFLIERGQAWVHAQRDHHRPGARTLAVAEKAAFSPFFAEPILDIALVKCVPAIENPGFYRDLEAIDIPPPLDFTTMEGITFVDTILVSDREHPPDQPLAPLLFHEFVHVVQYAMLGLPVFIDRYVRGWGEAGHDYFKIPLEKDAYALQDRFVAQPNEDFSVEEEVRRQLGIA